MLSRGHKENHPATVQNYFYAIIALSVLLYLLGGLGVLVVYSNNAISFAREQIPFYIELKDSASEAEIFKLEQQLGKSAYVKTGTVRFISKEEAKKKLIDKDLTEEDIMIFGENLLPNSIEFHLKSDYIGQYKKIVSELKTNQIIADVSHTEEVVRSFSTNLQRIGFITVIFVLFFIFVAITLIRNTLKLSMLANRHTIKILQIAGAANDYIQKPYINRSLINGLICGIMATFALIISIFVIQSQIEELKYFSSLTSFIAIYAGLITFGVLIFWGSAYFSLKKLFSMPTEEWN